MQTNGKLSCIATTVGGFSKYISTFTSENATLQRHPSEVDTCIPIMHPYYSKQICHSSLQMFSAPMDIPSNIFHCTLYEELSGVNSYGLVHSIWLN